MNYLFIQYGNTVINVNHICGVQFKKVDVEDAKFLGIHENGRDNGAILHVRTQDGQDYKFLNEDAEAVWDYIKNISLVLLPEQD